MSSSSSRPSLSQSMGDEQFFDKREKPESLSSKKRILYEIECLLDMQEKGLGLDVINARSRHERRIPNRDLYKLYKALLEYMDVRPTFVYTGNSILDMETAQELMQEKEKSLNDLEPSL